MPEAAQRRHPRATAGSRPAPRPRPAWLPSLAAALWAIAGGAFGALSVPPFDQSWLAWVALVPLLHVLSDASAVAAGICGLLMGLTMFTAIGYGTWAYDPSAFVAVVGGLTLLLGAVFAATRALERAWPAPWLRAWLLPALWVLGERLSTAANVPWAAGLGQTGHLPLIQSAAMLGAAWVSFLILLVNRSLAIGLEAWSDQRRSAADRRAAAIWAIVPAAVVLAGTLAYGVSTLRAWTPSPRTIRVASIQPLIQTHEFRYEGMIPAFRARNTASVADLTGAALGSPIDLLVWPEGGDGLFAMRAPARRARLAELARESGATLLISSYDLAGDGRLFNSVFAIAPDGTLAGRYDKVALTPMGEREFTAGTSWTPLPTRFGPVGPLICFESIFAAPARALVAQGAVLLLISTSDATFRNSSIAALHARSAVYRAVENRRAVIQSANTGPSMLIAPTGAVQARTPFFARALLEGQVELRDDPSLYARLGDAPLLALCVAPLALVAIGRRRGRAGEANHLTALRRPAPAWSVVALAVAALLLGGGLAAVSLRLSSAEAPSLPTWRAALDTFLSAPAVPLSGETAASFRQRQPNTCGPAALAFLLNYLGVEADEAAVAAHVTLTPQGTSLADLASAAHGLGFDAWGERQNIAALRDTPKPLIAHIRDDHYVVVLALTGDGVDVFDPTVGYARMELGEFQRLWKGNILVVRFPAVLR